MGYYKRMLEQLSIEMGLDGEITDEVMEEASRRQKPIEDARLDKAITELANKKKEEDENLRAEKD